MSRPPENDDMQTPASQFGDAEETNYSELARANLARLRGDYDLAERQCMALLKQTPHDPTVAALLGDVSSEQSKLDEALQWYEMAVDAGAPSGIEEKLDAIRVRVKERDATTSEREIGLSQRTWTSPPVLLGGAVIILMLLVCAYVAGTYRTPAKTPVVQEQAPIVLPRSGQSLPVNDGGSQPVTHPTDPPRSSPDSAAQDAAIPSAPTNKVEFDADLQPYFATASGFLARVTSAASVPRDHAVIIDVSLLPGEDPRTLAAQVAQATLAVLKDPTTLIVRVISGGKPIFLADCTREKFDAAERSDHPTNDGAPLADSLLSNEWKDANWTPPSGR